MLQGVCKAKLNNNAITLNHLCEQKLGLSDKISPLVEESSNSHNSHKG
jgi:hypothetical protein